MSETISLEWIGRTLRELQAEQRSIRDENKLIRNAISEMANVLLPRIGNFESHVDIRLDEQRKEIAGLLEKLATGIGR
jgi:molecular chaperone GrpE (heat shock protein)